MSRENYNPDWAAGRFSNYSKEHVQYTPSRDYDEFTDTIFKRIREREVGHHLITFIGTSIEQILQAMPDYRSVHFERAYAYNEGMVALDVVYTLSKKQTQAVLGESVVEKMVDAQNWEACQARNHTFTAGDWQKLRQVRVSGYVFAQTYTKETGAGTAILEGCPAPLNTSQLGWERNITSSEDDGFYFLEGGYNVQIWRAQFVQTRVGNPLKSFGKFQFLAKTLPKALAMERFEERMHTARAHPDFEYAVTTAIEGVKPHHPEGYFWRENITAINQQVEEVLPKEGYEGPTLYAYEWRRPKSRPVDDLPWSWLEPGVEVKFLNKKQFGEMFGPWLPKNMGGMDFATGFLASVSWIGEVKFSVRNRDPVTGEIKEPTVEHAWPDDVFLPFRTHEFFRGIQEFKERMTAKKDDEGTEVVE